MSHVENRKRGWWLIRQERDAEGSWDIGVQFLDGHRLDLHLLPSHNLDLVIADAVAAHLAGDVRWTQRRDRGHT